MAYVINGGDKAGERFQQFVDLCCRAFNIIRRNGNLFINLFSLVGHLLTYLLLTCWPHSLHFLPARR